MKSFLSELPLRFAAAILGVLVAQGVEANAGHCKQFFVQKVVAVPVYQQAVYYSVGDNVRLEALAQKISERVAPQVAALVAQQLNAPQTLQQSTVSPVLIQRCASCHNGTKAFDIRGGLSDSQYRVFSNMAGRNVFPEGTEAMRPVIAKLQAEGKLGDVVEAILATPQAQQQTAPPANETPAPPAPEAPAAPPLTNGDRRWDAQSKAWVEYYDGQWHALPAPAPAASPANGEPPLPPVPMPPGGLE